jgi:ribosome-binding protein aMBF1 (putative translation factor)
MQHIKNTFSTIDQILKQKEAKPAKKKLGRGLLASSTSATQDEAKRKQPIEIVAEYVAGIRSAREEMLNGN